MYIQLYLPCLVSWTGKKLGSAVRKNLLMWGVLTGLTILLILLLVFIGKDVDVGTLINVFVSISNTFTLFCVIFLLGNIIRRKRTMADKPEESIKK